MQRKLELSCYAHVPDPQECSATAEVMVPNDCDFAAASALALVFGRALAALWGISEDRVHASARLVDVDRIVVRYASPVPRGTTRS